MYIVIRDGSLAFNLSSTSKCFLSIFVVKLYLLFEVLKLKQVLEELFQAFMLSACPMSDRNI